MYYVNKDSDGVYSVSLEDQGNTVAQGDWAADSFMDSAFNALLSILPVPEEDTDSEHSGFTIRNLVDTYE